eukprot:814890-Rhodomonas_salina.1
MGHEERVIVNYQTQDPSQMLGFKAIYGQGMSVYDVVAKFAEVNKLKESDETTKADQDKLEKELGFEGEMAWGTPLNDADKNWNLFCWKVQKKTTVGENDPEFDTIVLLQEKAESRWLAWVYDNKNFHRGMSVYATVSNDLFLSGYWHLFDQSGKKYTLKGNTPTANRNYLQCTTKTDPSFREWLGRSALGAGLKFYTSPRGLYIIDARQTQAENNLEAKPKQAWQKDTWEIISREDPVW